MFNTLKKKIVWMVSQNSHFFYEKKTFKEVSRKPFTLKEKQDPWYYSIKHLLLFQINALISIEHIVSTVSQCLSYYPSCGPCPWDYTCKLQRFPSQSHSMERAWQFDLDSHYSMKYILFLRLTRQEKEETCSSTPTWQQASYFSLFWSFFY